MPVDFIGMISHRLASEIIPPRGPIFDPDFIRDFAQAHERGGFDRILIGYYSNAPDGFLVAAHAAASTERLGILLAHRPGFVAPTVAARKLATLDQFSGGRAALGVGLGGSSRSTRRLPPERHLWAAVDDLRIERVGPYGSAGAVAMRLPDGELHASIGRVDEMIAAAGQYRAGAEGGPGVAP